MSNLIQRSQASHWYTPDGQAAHRTGDHWTTLRDARKLGLLPSVTTIMKLLAKPSVEDWRVEQAILTTLELEDHATQCAHTSLSPLLHGTPLPVLPTESRATRVAELLDTRLDRARDFGSLVHAGVEYYATHLLLPVGMSECATQFEPVLPWLRAYKGWHDANVDKVHGTEECVVNLERGYAGRIDLHLTHLVHGELVVDVKTQAVRSRPSFYDEWCYQLAAYYKVVPGTTGVMSLIIDSTPPEPGKSPAVHEYLWTPAELEHGWQVFEALLNLWQRVKKYYPATPKPVTKEAA
jgi:hypothetical protein